MLIQKTRIKQRTPPKNPRLRNDGMLVQEFLDGIEYVVDSISRNGKHIVVGIWQYKKLKDDVNKSISYEWTPRRTEKKRGKGDNT